MNILRISILYLSLLSTCFLSSQTTQAENNSSFLSDNPHSQFYVLVKGGGNYYPPYKPDPQGGDIEPIGKDYLKNGYAFYLTGGYNFTPYFSGELEYNFTRNDFDKFKVFRDYPPRGLRTGDVRPIDGYSQTHEFFGNLSINIPNKTAFVPYVGFGMGVINYQEHNSCGKPSIVKPAYQFLGGVNYILTKRVWLVVDAQYVRMQKAQIINNCLSPTIKHRHLTMSMGLKFNV